MLTGFWMYLSNRERENSEYEEFTGFIGTPRAGYIRLGGLLHIVLSLHSVECLLSTSHQTEESLPTVTSPRSL